MRDPMDPVMHVGVLVVVFGQARIHAAFIGEYSFTGTGPFGWTVAYAGVLCLLAYGFGLLEVPCSRREARRRGGG